MTEYIFDQVRQIAANVFNVPLEKVTIKSSSTTIENWDSLQLLNLVLALEQEFGVQFEPEDIEQMISVELIVKLTQEKLSKTT